MERKLRTILASDVVSFSRLMANDEDMTLALLKQRREIIDQIINSDSGRIFGSAGDSVIAEFDSPVKAVECAVQIQGKMKAINENMTEKHRMQFRIGINLGDVLISGNNLYGDAVNIAARLEAEAEPEGICLSKSVFEMVNQKLHVAFEDLGLLNLKNIEGPVQAYAVIESKGGGRFLQQLDAPQFLVEKAEAGSLAVMLFKSLSNDEEQAYFCEGFSEDLISALSRYRKLTVVSGSASFSYREKSKSPREIGQELGVRYILEGSVRKLGSKMRISASLIAVGRENTVWSSNYDTSIDEIFEIQDELVETIISTLVGRVEADAAQQLAQSRPENLQAYDLVLQGLEFHRKGLITKDNARKAFDFFDQAVELDPNYARAHAWRACSLANSQSWEPGRFGDNWLEQCISSVSRALEIDENDPEAHRIMGAIKLETSDFDAARYHHDKARILCPSDAYIRSKRASCLILLGEPSEALEEIKSAMRLDPFCPDILYEDEGIIHFWLENWSEGIESFKKLKMPTKNSLFYLAACLQKKGEWSEATTTLSQACGHSSLDIEKFIGTRRYRDKEQSACLKDVLESIAA